MPLPPLIAISRLWGIRVNHSEPIAGERLARQARKGFDPDPESPRAQQRPIQVPYRESDRLHASGLFRPRQTQIRRLDPHDYNRSLCEFRRPQAC